MHRSSHNSPRSVRVGAGSRVRKFRRASLVELFTIVDEVDVLFGPVFGITDVNVVSQLLLGVVGVVLGELS